MPIRSEPPSTADLRGVLGRILDPTALAGPPGGCLAVSAPGVEEVVAAGHRQVFDDNGPLIDRLPMTVDTAHDLGSVTKVVATTALVMTLVDRGVMSLEDPVARLLPSWQDGVGGDATIADLLLHRAGLWEWWPTYLSASTPTAALDLITSLPLRHPPRSGRYYSDLGFMLLGQIIQAVTRASLRDLAAELVFDPLGMESTRYAAPPDGMPVAAGPRGDVIERQMIATGKPYPIQAPVLGGFARWRENVTVGEVNDGNSFHAFAGVAGHAGVFSTAGDLLLFGRGLLDSLNGGGLWKPDTVRTFCAEGPDAGQAIGFRTYVSDVDGRRTTGVGHTGFPGTGLAILPDLDATVVLLTNRLHVTTSPPPPPFQPLWTQVLDGMVGLVAREDS